MGDWIGWVWLRQIQHGGGTEWGVFSLAVLLVGVFVSGGSCLLIKLLVEAIEETGMTELQACQEMALDQAQWVRQKQGDGAHASIQRADRLPQTVLARWGEKLARRFGDVEEYRQRAEFYLAVTMQPRALQTRLEVVPELEDVR